VRPSRHSTYKLSAPKVYCTAVIYCAICVCEYPKQKYLYVCRQLVCSGEPSSFLHSTADSFFWTITTSRHVPTVSYIYVFLALSPHLFQYRRCRGLTLICTPALARLSFVPRASQTGCASCARCHWSCVSTRVEWVGSDCRTNAVSRHVVCRRGMQSNDS
jgi:hypothetical protein